MSPANDASTTQQAASEPVYEPISYPSATATFGVQPGGWKSNVYDNSQPSSEPDITWFPSNRFRDIQPAPQHQHGQHLIPEPHTMDEPQPPHLAQHSYFTNIPHTIHQPLSAEQSYSFQHSQPADGTAPPEPASMTNALNDDASAVDSYFRRPPAVIRVNQACDKCRERKVRCSGGHPLCDRCKSRGLPCTYTPGKSTRSTRGVGGEKRPRLRKTKTEHHPCAAPPVLFARWASTDAVPTNASLGRSFEPVPPPAPPIIGQTFVHHHIPTFSAVVEPPRDAELALPEPKGQNMDWEESLIDPALRGLDASHSYSSMFNDIIDVSQTAAASDHPSARMLHPIITTDLNVKRTSSSDSSASSCPSSTTESHFSFSSEHSSEYSRPTSPETMKALESALSAVIMKADPTLIRVDDPSRDNALDSAPQSHAWPSRAPSPVDHASPPPLPHKYGQSITSSETIKADRPGGLDTCVREAERGVGSQNIQSGKYQAGREDDMVLQYPEGFDEPNCLHVRPAVNSIVPSPSLD